MVQLNELSMNRLEELEEMICLASGCSDDSSGVVNEKTDIDIDIDGDGFPDIDIDISKEKDFI